MLPSKGRLYLSLSLILFVTFVAYYSQTIIKGGVFDVITGLIFVWFLPGFALMTVLYPNQLVRLDIALFSVLMSLVINILIGAILEILNFNLNEAELIYSLCFVTNSLFIVGIIIESLGSVNPVKPSTNGKSMSPLNRTRNQ